MSQAEQQPRPENKRVDLITRFKERYNTVLTEAMTSQVHTDTDGWQQLYSNHVNAQRDRRLSLAKRLRGMADAIEMRAPSEEDDKTINEFKKESAAIRESDLSFSTQTVEPVKQPVLDCQRVISEFRAQAHLDEADAPMLNIGLEQLMRDAINGVQKVEWNDEAGRVVILS